MSLDDNLYYKYEILPKNIKDNIFIFEILIENLPKKKINLKYNSDFKCDFSFSKSVYNFKNELLDKYIIQIPNMSFYYKDFSGNLLKKYNHTFFNEVSKRKLMINSNNFANVIRPINKKILKIYLK